MSVYAYRSANRNRVQTKYAHRPFTLFSRESENPMFKLTPFILWTSASVETASSLWRGNRGSQLVSRNGFLCIDRDAFRSKDMRNYRRKSKTTRIHLITSWYVSKSTLVSIYNIVIMY